MKLTGFNIVNIKEYEPRADSHPARYWKRQADFWYHNAMAAWLLLLVTAGLLAFIVHVEVKP